MTLRKPKLNKSNKLSVPRMEYSQNFANDAHDIQQLFIDRLPNHTLREVCLYIAGHFHKKLKAKDQRIKELQAEIDQLWDIS